MKYKAPGVCPVCQEKLAITKLSCPKCRTQIEGDFQPCVFCKMPNEQLEFAITFLKNRGNIKDVEKELGISYPTVRAKLDSVIEALGFSTMTAKEKQVEEDTKIAAKKEIIDALEQGHITAKEAATKMKEL